MIAGILPEIAHGLNVAVNTAGLLITIFAWAYALGSPVLATATGKLERKRLLLVSLVVFVVANVLAALAPSFAVLVGARILAACGAALYTDGPGRRRIAVAGGETRASARAGAVRPDRSNRAGRPAWHLDRYPVALAEHLSRGRHAGSTRFHRGSGFVPGGCQSARREAESAPSSLAPTGSAGHAGESPAVAYECVCLVYLPGSSTLFVLIKNGFHTASRNRLRNSSKLPRPNMERFTNFKRLTCPSTGPLLYGRSKDVFTAS